LAASVHGNHPKPFLARLQHLAQLRGKFAGIGSPRQETGDVVLDDFWNSAHRKRDHWKARRERLQQDARHSFVLRRDHQKIEIPHDGGDIVVPVEKLHGQAGGKVQHIVVIRAIAEQRRSADHESNAWRVRNQNPCGLKKLRVPLSGRDASDDADAQLRLFLKAARDVAEVGGSIGNDVDLANKFPQGLRHRVTTRRDRRLRPAQCEAFQEARASLGDEMMGVK